MPDPGPGADAADTGESLFKAPPLAEQERMVEAILFATAEPVTVAEMNARMPHGADAAEAVRLLQQPLRGPRRQRGARSARPGRSAPRPTSGS